jgi:hypothetical protein
MEIKFKLDSEKAAKATVAIVASYGLRQVSEGTECPQLTIANAIALIVIVAILYGPVWHQKPSIPRINQNDI